MFLSQQHDELHVYTHMQSSAEKKQSKIHLINSVELQVTEPAKRTNIQHKELDI